MLVTRFCRLPMAEEDADVGGGEAPKDEPKEAPKDAPKGAPAETVSKADYDALKSDFESLGSEIKKLTKANSSKSDNDRVAKGEAEKLLAEKSELLEKLSSRLETYEKRDKERANDLLAKLPEDVRKRLSPFGEKLDTTDWLTLLEAEVDTHVDANPSQGQGDGRELTPPSTGSPMGSGGNKSRQVSDLAKGILDSLMRDAKYQDKLTMSKEDDKPLKSKFSRPVKDFFADMRKVKASPFTQSEGLKRG